MTAQYTIRETAEYNHPTLPLYTPPIYEVLDANGKVLASTIYREGAEAYIAKRLAYKAKQEAGR